MNDANRDENRVRESCYISDFLAFVTALIEAKYLGQD